MRPQMVQITNPMLDDRPTGRLIGRSVLEIGERMAIILDSCGPTM